MSAAVSSITLLLVLVIPVTILEAAPLAPGDNDTKFLDVVEQIRKVSASLSTVDPGGDSLSSGQGWILKAT